MITFIFQAASTTWMVAFAKMNKLVNYTVLLDKAALHGELLRKFGINGEDLQTKTFSFTFIRHPFHRIVSKASFIYATRNKIHLRS